jgi:tetratricopeptide (TPR) repeat protein
MVNMTESYRSDEDPDDPTGLGTLYEREISTAIRHLHAQASDLKQLLVFIVARQVSRQQIPELLKQAYSRLSAARESRVDLSDTVAKESSVGPLIERAERALETGGGLSLDRADEACEEVFRCCIELEGEAEYAAHIRSRQAQVAAARQEYRRAADLFAEAAVTPGLAVPQQWRYQTDRALVLEDLGRELVDAAALEEAIGLYETRILPLASREQRPDDWATTQNHLGIALGVLGRQQRGTAMLERALVAFENALSERGRERMPLDWAATQNNLGNALGLLGQRRGDIEMMERSAEAFERALEERCRERAPQDWATTQNNLGAVLLTLGHRKKDTHLLEKAIEAYRNVLLEWTRDEVPLDWATVMDNVGTALRMLGESRNGSRTLEQSVAAYRSALAERTRERVPQDWAMTQNNLGAALQKLGERQDDPEILTQSVNAYENALQEWTRERRPMGWTMTKANQGVGRKLLAQRVKDADIARMAVADLEAVLEVFRNASHAQYYELAEEQLAEARAVLECLTAPGTC